MEEHEEDEKNTFKLPCETAPVPSAAVLTILENSTEFEHQKNKKKKRRANKKPRREVKQHKTENKLKEYKQISQSKAMIELYAKLDFITIIEMEAYVVRKVICFSLCFKKFSVLVNTIQKYKMCLQDEQAMKMIWIPKYDDAGIDAAFYCYATIVFLPETGHMVSDREFVFGSSKHEARGLAFRGLLKKLVGSLLHHQLPVAHSMSQVLDLFLAKSTFRWFGHHVVFFQPI